MKKSYSSLRKILGSYWNSYGGFSALLRSPFLHLAFLVTFLSYNEWLYNEWWEYPIEILPNLIGFTLGGYAILLAFSDQRFLDLIRGHEEEEDAISLYMGLNSSFVHFLLLQIFALLIAIVWASSPIKSGQLYDLFPVCLPELSTAVYYIICFFNMLGFLIFIYAITAGLAAILSIFQIAKAYDKVTFPKDNNN